MHHFGSGICSQSFFTRGAIFTVIVPATTITSQWRGVGRTTEPIWSMSTRAAAAVMNSMAQQLVAIGKIHRLFVADHSRTLSTEVSASESPGIRSR